MGKGGVETGESGLWSFALRMWEQPDVPSAAIRLQDRWEISVCLLLCALWLEQRGATPDAELAGKLVGRARLRDREWITPLRRLRREASERLERSDWKRHLQNAELEAERLLLSELEALAGEHARFGTGAEEGWLDAVLPGREPGMESLLEELRRAAACSGR